MEVTVYSASKASQEILFRAYFKTYLNYQLYKIKFATTRSGNIIEAEILTKIELYQI